MFTNEEGEGWQQLGEGLMPSSSKDAGAMLDGLGHFGEKSIHGLLGGTSMPDMKEALGAMFGPQPVTLDGGAAQLPRLDFFDSGSATMQNGAFDAGTAPQTVESLQTPALDQSGMMTGAQPGADAARFQPQTAGSESMAGLNDSSAGIGDIGKAFSDMISKMGEMISAMAQGPMGFLGSLLNFFLTIFSEIVSSIAQIMNETARAAASLASEAWKKHLEMAT
ncbi:MAG: hypothetical protein K2X27_08845 [Candidatus Obscuribacterales bacterium]|nr:hypothetical protein [Candidatus Obscuribacterales bacterium]